MRVCALLSGGKDSNYSLYKALKEGHEIACILVLKPARSDSWMFHVPYTELALLQAEAMGYRDRARLASVSGVREDEVEELYSILRDMHESIGFDAISVGALASMYQYRRIKGIADRIGVGVYAPHWQMDQESYMRMLVGDGIQFILTRITTMGLPHRLLGKIIGPREVEEIIMYSRRYGFNPAFEGGEAETLVVDAPHYKKRLGVKGKIRVLSEFESEYIIEDAWLEDKL